MMLSYELMPIIHVRHQKKQHTLVLEGKMYLKYNLGLITQHFSKLWVGTH